MRLVREALDTLTLPDAVMGVTLRVESVTGNDGAQGDLFDRGFASAPMVEDAIIQLTDDQGDVVVEPVNSQHPLLEERTTWVSRSTPSGRTTRRIDASARRIATLLLPRAADAPSLTLQLLPLPKVVTVSTEPRRDHDVPVALSRRQRVARHRRSGGAGSGVGRAMAGGVCARVFPLRA